jgi:hypothetical protein
MFELVVADIPIDLLSHLFLEVIFTAI